MTELLLNPPNDTAEELAEAIIRALDDKRASLDQWVAILYEPNVKELVPFGPYPTQNQATRATSQLVSAGPRPAQAFVRKVRGIPADDTPNTKRRAT